MARIAGTLAIETAARIRAESLILFARYGYAAVSMRQIAGAVGVMPGALYHHYATKQHLLMALMEGHMRELLAAWDQADDTEARATVRLTNFVRFHIGYHLSRPDEVFLSYMELRALETENYVTLEGLRRTYESGLKDILEQGEREACFTLDDVHVTAMAILAMLTGVNNWFKQSGRLSADIITDHYVALTLHAIEAQASPEGNKNVPPAFVPTIFTKRR